MSTLLNTTQYPADQTISEIPSGKRKAESNPTSPNSTPLSKISALGMGDADQPVTIVDLKALMELQTKTIMNSLGVEFDRLANELKISFQGQLAETNKRIDAVETDMSNQIHSIKNDVGNCINQMHTTTDDFHRITKLNELRINGIPFDKDENLLNIYTEIAKSIEFDPNMPLHLPTLMRTYRRDLTTKLMLPSSTIIVKFVAKQIRDMFYSCYLKKIANKQSITPNNIMLPEGGRIMICESLTLANSKLFVAAIQLKKEQQLSQVYTQDGLICIKVNKTDKAKVIRTQHELDLFMSQLNENGSQSNEKQSQQTTTNNRTTTKPSGSHHRRGNKNNYNKNNNNQSAKSTAPAPPAATA